MKKLTAMDLIYNNKEDIIKEFSDKYLLSKYADTQNIELLNRCFSKSIKYLSTNNIIKLKKIHNKLIKLHLKINTPYVVFINELDNLRNIIINLLLRNNYNIEISDIYKIYDEIENNVAKKYLELYINQLIETCNVRLANLNDMVEQNVIDYYAYHLKWLISVAKAIKNDKTINYPQVNPSICLFGKWLKDDAKTIIKNNSKLKNLVMIHNQLHLISEKIKQIIISKEKDFNVLLTYLERCEFISLSIGTELALIDNTIVNQKAVKDTLTGALSRQVLEQIFQNQYDISLATNSNFIIAMCDLDFFKKVNDTYGHIAGDKMLQNFVKITKNNLRSSDIIIRYGGEEFIIILTSIDYKKGNKVLDNIRNKFEQFKLDFENNTIQTTVSMGMVEVEAKQKYKQQFIEEYILIADKRLYQAKENGRNQVI
ncbi:MAG: sensor domain-containing diguanylate cyclase [Campylobacterota bacterium]|nr:sensor domain-containing diguanylate cyclase [Campylobacterota bacterium]